MGLLVGVIACTGLAQFVLYTCWVLYTTFKFGWGPTENGWSLFAVGVRVGDRPGRPARPPAQAFRHPAPGDDGADVVHRWRISVYGAVTQGWMMYVVIACNLLGFTVQASTNSIVSAAASADTQGQTMGAVSSLNSLMAVLAPVIGAPLLATVSHLPPGDWRIGAPFFFCALLQALALLFAWLHFRGVKAHAARPSAAVDPAH